MIVIAENITNAFLNCYGLIMDIGMVVELNIMKEHVDGYAEVKQNHMGRLAVLEEFEFK